MELSRLRGSLGPTMEIVYRHQTTNEVIGTKIFDVNRDTTNHYVHQVLLWWDGKRPARGVEVEDAHKCRICEFEEGCTWRAAKIAELAKKRQRMKSPPSTEIPGP